MSESKPALSPGDRLGPYEIVAAIGAGGMGEVYRAKDSRLSREVAIKVLPASLSTDPERLRRFEQEARAAGLLNHPNITAVYDIGRSESNDAPYIVQELLEGETLRTALLGGRIPIRRAVDYARQMAQGLAVAHEKGIVHRDLKPENLFLTRDGRVKILDFGLAKLTHAGEASGPQSHLSTLSGQTEPGMVLGTAGYMSPEQVRGRPADARSDLFTFGAILYEMVSGKRAFGGQSAADTLAAILTQEPSELSLISRDVPPALARIVRHCLEKNPDLRFRSAHDLAFDLESVSTESGDFGSAAPTGRQRPAVSAALWAAGLSLFALLAFLALRGAAARNRGTARGTRVFTQLTELPGRETHPALSPDGKTLLYVYRGDIWTKRVGGENATNLTPNTPEADTGPVFSPDGTLIAFRSERGGGGIFVMGATGESVRRLTDSGYSPAWTPDAQQIVFATQAAWNPLARGGGKSELWEVSLGNGQRRRIFEGDAVEPSVSPKGLRIAYWSISPAGKADIWTIPAAGPAKGEGPVPVTQEPSLDWNPCWSADGKLLYFASDRDGSWNLWRVAIDEKTGKLTGSPEQVTLPSRGVMHVRLAANGHYVVFQSFDPALLLEKHAFDPAREQITGEPSEILRFSFRAISAPDVSPDGKRVTFDSFGWDSDIFVVGSDGTRLVRLTNDAHKDASPRFSPDGARIAFRSNRDGQWRIWTVPADGGMLTPLADAADGPPVWSPDGRRIAYLREGGAAILRLSEGAGSQSFETLPGPPEGATFLPNSWSPDGEVLAGTARAKDDSKIVLYRFASRSYEVVAEEGESPAFLSDSRRLLYLGREGVTLLDTRSRRSRPIAAGSQDNLLTRFAISKDSTVLYFARQINQGDIWMASLDSEIQADTRKTTSAK